MLSVSVDGHRLALAQDGPQDAGEGRKVSQKSPSAVADGIHPVGWLFQWAQMGGARWCRRSCGSRSAVRPRRWKDICLAPLKRLRFFGLLGSCQAREAYPSRMNCQPQDPDSVDRLARVPSGGTRGARGRSGVQTIAGCGFGSRRHSRRKFYRTVGGIDPRCPIIGQSPMASGVTAAAGCAGRCRSSFRGAAGMAM